MFPTIKAPLGSQSRPVYSSSSLCTSSVFLLSHITVSNSRRHYDKKMKLFFTTKLSSNSNKLLIFLCEGAEVSSNATGTSTDYLLPRSYQNYYRLLYALQLSYISMN